MAKRLILIGCFLVASAFLWAQDTGKDKKPEPLQKDDKQTESEQLISQTNQIIELIAKLESQDSAQAKAAFQKLKEIGLPAIPFLVDKLKDKGIYLELVSQIHAFQLPSADEIKANLKIWQELIGVSSEKEVAVIEKYFYSKYLQAVQSYQKEQYQEALDTINAINKLEPKVSFREKIQLFRILCEEKIIQKSVVRVTLRTPKDIYEIGDKIFVTFKMENVSLDPLEINLGANPFMMINRTFAEYSPLGDYVSTTDVTDEKLPVNSIKLNPQEIWEHTFTIDTSKDSPTSIYYRTYDIWTEIKASKIKSGSNEAIKRIISLPATIRVFPPSVEKVLKDPLPCLAQALDGGIPIDIFLCALLVPEKDKDKAIELLMRSLDSFPEESRRAVMTSLKHITRLPLEIDEKAWRQWWKERKR
ncbi:MAG: hypothetical protein HY811_06070 [Planctomycetes bacterium]|nr:hypothetical protein [Planctomycetota bacterium]